MSKKIQLSDHFTYGRLLRFVMPSILMILCTSVYTIVDGFFVSNYVGKTAFAALNLVWPVLMAVSTIGFLIGTGGCALVSKTLGEGNREGKSIFQHADYSDIHWNGDFVCNWFSADTANCNPTGCKGSGDAGEQHSIR